MLTFTALTHCCQHSTCTARPEAATRAFDLLLAADLFTSRLLDQHPRTWEVFETALSTIMDTVHQPDIFVAPLQITKDCSRTPSNTSSSSQRTLTGRGPKKVSHQGGQFTPPLTPQSSEEDLQGRNDLAQTTFQTYLRAFHSFHPTCDENSSTVTLPLNYGDIILVHSVHSSGWADGTLLSSGARGWLPTNYCEAYNSEPARILLKALTKFWDLAKGSSHHGLGALANQDYVRGLVAGVRCLLVSDPLPGLQCHSRPSESNPRVGADKLLESRVICDSIPQRSSTESQGSLVRIIIICQNGEITRGIIS